MRSNKALSVFHSTPPLVFLSLSLLLVSVLLFPGRPAQAQSYKVLYSFTGPTGDASWPNGVLRESDGTFYGVTCYGGMSYNGTAFSFSPQGKETILYNFLGGYGSCPDSLLSWNGQFYGATETGGSEGGGAIFRLGKNGSEFVLHSFPRADAPHLYFGDGKGNFYGTSGGGAFGYGTIFKIDSSGNLIVLYNFGFYNSAGYSPGNLYADKRGNLYGVTFDGADPNCKCGALFRLDSGGVLKVLHVFTGGTDGAYPSGLVGDEEGNVYGGTIFGGSSNANCPTGCGTIYELTASGQYKILYNFTGLPDGESPTEIVRDAAGNLYGITDYGGDAKCYSYFNNGIGCGVVFKLDTAGREAVLHAFVAAPDGAYPNSLFWDSDGVLYGVTLTGGDANCSMFGSYTGCGTIFELTP
jgi:uncharacterized repeat protein (TIGR03803 family)